MRNEASKKHQPGNGENVLYFLPSQLFQFLVRFFFSYSCSASSHSKELTTEDKKKHFLGQSPRADTKLGQLAGRRRRRRRLHGEMWWTPAWGAGGAREGSSSGERRAAKSRTTTRRPPEQVDVVYILH